MAGADAAVVVTEWPQLKEVDWAQTAAAMRRPVLFDGRNLLDPAGMRALGYTYMGVGRP
jgi:UDPglucose 6-dehydrogenase